MITEKTETKEMIFISYARVNKGFVERLISDLQYLGLTVWIDTKGLEAGTPDWDQALRDAIGQSRVILLMASPESRRSPFVAGELLVADACKCPVIPVWVSGEKWIDCIPLPLSRTQYIDCRGEKYYTGLQHLLNRLTGVTPTTLEESRLKNATEIAREVQQVEVNSNEYKNRRMLLERVKKFWISDVLERSLHHATMIQLGKEDRTHLVSWTTTFRTHRGKGSSYTLPAGTTITDIFDRQGYALLITGEPGSGKTTTLLELTRDMISRAERDIELPIPVVFNLSSWLGPKQLLTDWLILELHSKYQISKQVAQEWVENQELLLLLDGLDEVRIDKRDACVEAINAYRQNHGETQIAVCCRIADYEALRARLKLESAIHLQPLTKPQIEQYLDALGSDMVSIKSLILDDSDLLKLAEVPLMLNIMLIAFHKDKHIDFQQFETSETRRAYLFKLYIDQMLSQKDGDVGYEKNESIVWLSWLAKKMVLHGQTVFLIENLQPSHLDNNMHVLIHRFATRGAVLLAAIIALFLIREATGIVSLAGFVLGTIVGIIVSVVSLILRERVINTEHNSSNIIIKEVNRVSELFKIDLPNELASVVPGSLISATIGGIYAIFYTALAGLDGSSMYLHIVNYWATSGLITAVICLVSANLFFPDHSIKTYESLFWSAQKASSFLTGAYSLTTVIILAAILMAIGMMFTAGWKIGVAGGFGVLITFAYILGILSGLTSKEVETKTIPNQGIWNSLRNGLKIGLVTGIAFFVVITVFGLIAGVSYRALSSGLALFFIAGFTFAGGYGVYSFAQHINLRHILYWSGKIPLNYARFLNFAVDRIILQRVGGGYIFIHRLLLEYFAGINKPENEKQI